MTCTYSQRSTKPADTGHVDRADDGDAWSFDGQGAMPLPPLVTSTEGAETLSQQDQTMPDLDLASEDPFSSLSRDSITSFFPFLDDLTTSTQDVFSDIDIIDFGRFDSPYGIAQSNPDSETLMIEELMYQTQGNQTVNLFTQSSSESRLHEALSGRGHRVAQAQYRDGQKSSLADSNIETLLLTHASKLTERLETLLGPSNAQMPTTSEELLRGKLLYGSLASATLVLGLIIQQSLRMLYT